MAAMSQLRLFSRTREITPPSQNELFQLRCVSHTVQVHCRLGHCPLWMQALPLSGFVLSLCPCVSSCFLPKSTHSEHVQSSFSIYFSMFGLDKSLVTFLIRKYLYVSLTSLSPPCGILEEKKRYKWTFLQRNRSTDIENKLMVTKGEKVGEGLNWETGTNIYTHYCI